MPASGERGARRTGKRSRTVMKKIVLLRHGESVWNRENRFTGWTDVDLSEKGVAEAVKAGETLRKEGFHFGRAYTSYLKRAVKTLDVVLDRMDRDWIPVTKTWRLNEKHYGMLQGLNKRETAEKYAGPPRRTAGGGSRQQPAGHHQEPERDFGRGHFGVQPSDCRALRLRIRRGVGLCEGLFPGRPGRDRLPDGGRRQSGPAGLSPPPHFRCARRRFRRQSSADPFLIRFCVWGAEPVLRADGLHPTENDAAP